MLWFGLVSVTAACLTRITPDPEVPLRGHLGALQINLESCWKPCLLSGPICYPLCPAHTITAAESQAKVKHVMDVLGREELQRKSRDEEKRRLAIRYPFEVLENQQTLTDINFQASTRWTEEKREDPRVLEQSTLQLPRGDSALYKRLLDCGSSGRCGSFGRRVCLYFRLERPFWVKKK